MKVEHHSGISAECIAASVYEDGPPIYTVITRSPKFIDAEMRTHRMLSQNSSSSRAIPVAKVIKQVEEEPYIPFEWRKNQSGMQGDVAVDHPYLPRTTWIEARLGAIRHAEHLAELGVHKQHVNRLLEPFTWQWKVITATEWDNFFNLRCHPAAQPEMQALAGCIREAIEKAKPVDRSDGSWHLPFTAAGERVMKDEPLLMLSAARCARISYANHGTGVVDAEEDFELAERLMTDRHLTPFEHQARRILEPCQVSHIDKHGNQWSGNFRGWEQHRKTTVVGNSLDAWEINNG